MNGLEGSTRTGTRTQDQLIKSQLLYQLSYPRLQTRMRGAGRIGSGLGLGKLIFGKIGKFFAKSGKLAVFAGFGWEVPWGIFFVLLLEAGEGFSGDLDHVGDDDDELHLEDEKK